MNRLVYIWLLPVLFFLRDENYAVQHSRFSPAVTDGLFQTDSLLNITIDGDINSLMKDRFDDAVRHPLKLSYSLANEQAVSINIEGKTRGNFRRKQGGCSYPPIMLYFKKNDSTSASLFAGQKKLKLVLPCRNEELIIKEWLAYKIYNLITEQSFRTRLLSITWKNTARNKTEKPVYAFLLEDEDDMAARNKSFSVTRNQLPPTYTDSTAFFTMAIFQYLIGNTDWSVQYMQNIKLITTDTLNPKRPVTVPYDFDMSGWVNAPYAKPADELLLNSVRTRRFRGYCISNPEVYTDILKKFEKLKPEIYKLINGCSLLSAKTIASEIVFLDGFYSLIADREKLNRDLLYPCDKNGTGNVVIKGMANK